MALRTFNRISFICLFSLVFRQKSKQAHACICEGQSGISAEIEWNCWRNFSWHWTVFCLILCSIQQWGKTKTKHCGNVCCYDRFLQLRATGFLLGPDSLCLCFRDELCKPPLLSMRGFLRLCLWVLSPALTHKITITWFICLPRWQLHRWTLLLISMLFFHLIH